jgi:hypothetical protein
MADRIRVGPAAAGLQGLQELGGCHSLSLHVVEQPLSYCIS